MKLKMQKYLTEEEGLKLAKEKGFQAIPKSEKVEGLLKRLHKELLEMNRITIPYGSPLENTLLLLIDCKTFLETIKGEK